MGMPDVKPRHTLEDWKQWEGRWELVDGVAYDMTPAPSVVHQAIVTSIAAQLFFDLLAKSKAGKGHCQTFTAPIDVYLLDSVVQPDLIVVCDPAKIAGHGIIGPPDLVVEVVSPRSGSRDWFIKRNLYEAAGVPEYLIVDPLAETATLLRLTNGTYSEGIQFEWDTLVSLLGGKINVYLDEKLILP